MTRVLLVRHGATDWNETKRAQGQADVELNDKGRAQAAQVADELARLEVDAVYSSDLQRALDTATAIATRHDLEVTSDPAFREIDQGEWTGLTPDEIAGRWPELYGRDRYHAARPRGEAPGQVRARALEGLKRVVTAHPRGTVVVVGHGSMMRWIAAAALGYDDAESARVRGVSTGGIVMLDADVVGDRLVLSGLQRMDGKTTDVDDPNV